MKKVNDLVTLILVSYHSDNTLKKFLNQISDKYKIIITDNAASKTLKNEIEEKHVNVKVFIPESNLGNGGGINFALEKVDTKYAFYLDLDVELIDQSIDELIYTAEQNKDWAILAPNLKDYIYNSNHFIDKNLSKNFSKMKFVQGCALLFNLEKLKVYGFFDTKIFLYYEEDDLFFKYHKNNLNIILCKKIFIRHLGNSSTDREYNFEIELNRNWHYMWSKFYYYKKNYSYVKGLKETLGHFIKSIFKLSFFYLFNKKKFLIYKNRASGLINSYINKPSWRRPNIK
tara:strand:+ start:3551 stop:4408 length:858 start_codon:yes stop_codon:yes gene_type:complete